MKNLRKNIIFISLVILTFFIGLYFIEYRGISSWKLANEVREYSSEETNEYISQFVPENYMKAGVDYFNPRYSPQRLNKSIDQIDITNDYPFKYLEQIELKVRKVDRRKALKSIFEKITASSNTELERHLSVLNFLYKAAHHNQYVQPMYPDRTTVLDPIVLLELGEMRCGHVARVAADLFDAAGYKVRLVQLHAHVSAEIYYDGKWHLFEADLAGGPPIMVDGQIPSVEELSKTPFLIDKVPTKYEYYLSLSKVNSNSSMYPSYFFFSKKALSQMEASYYYKTATSKEIKNSKFYGWDLYKTDNHRWSLTDFEPKWEPSLPMFKNIKIKGNKFILEWEKSHDKDNDLLGYRVYLSEKSRGWNYKEVEAPDNVKKYFFGGWNPEMYDNVFKEPPSDLGLIETSSTKIEIPISDKKEVIFVTVMAYDRHGELVGRRLYNQSVELKLFR